MGPASVQPAVPSARQCASGRDANRFTFQRMKYATLFALLAAAYAIDPIAVDDLRNKFYALENVLWKNVTPWSVAGGSGDVELTKAFVAFDEKIKSVRLPPRYPVNSWLWQKATEKMMIINGYYSDIFLPFIRRQAQPGAVPAPVREWLDIADGILFTNSTSSVAQAVRKIHDLLEFGNMFRDNDLKVFETFVIK